MHNDSSYSASHVVMPFFWGVSIPIEGICLFLVKVQCVLVAPGHRANKTLWQNSRHSSE